MPNNLRVAQAIADRIARGDMDLGRVHIKQDGPHYLLNYSPEAMYGGDMTKVEEACRGLVVRDDARIMALPMPKFYNIGEPSCPPLPDEPYEIYDKIDGSLGIFWNDGAGWRCCTRGSFENEYTDFGQKWWADRVDASAFPPYWTVMVEICMDDDVNPRAAHFDEGLWFVAARDRYSGKDFWPGGVAALGLLRAHGWGSMTIENILARKDSEEGREGWVVRYGSGFRVKVKTAWYLRMFRAVTQLTPKHIRELMLGVGENWIDEFPDDLRAEAADMQRQITGQLQKELDAIYGAYSRIAGLEARKEYALAVKADYPEIAGWLFALRDNKFDEMNVLKHLNLYGLADAGADA